MFDEADLLPLSALQHLAFCARQCALIHVEGLWAENRLTAEGRHMHRRVDQTETRIQEGRRLVRGLRLRSLSLGLAGRADLVEFHPIAGEPPGGHADAARLPDVEGLWRPVPVESKHGRPKPGRCDEAQLCAQSICLEEMLDCAIPEGAIFYGKPRRRTRVAFTDELRAETRDLALRLHELIRSGQTPPAAYTPRCRSCSLLQLCLPGSAASGKSARAYLRRNIREAAQEAQGET